MDTPEKRALYEEIAARSDLWLQLVEARMAAAVTPEELAQRMGTTKTQVTRIEGNGYAYTLKTLRRYVKALGEDFAIEVRIQRQPSRLEEAAAAAP
ncbi:MAG: XRE family transcriptional regulator [Chloroflexi bacterium]|nr:XRE family transcriptional regulator [Chloroflexota bacterium]